MTANLVDPTVQHLRAMFDACEVGVIILDGDRRIVLWNGWIAQA